MDEELVRKLRRMMEDKDVNEFLLAALVEWVRKVREEGADRILEAEQKPVKTPLYFLIPFPGNPSRNKGRLVSGKAVKGEGWMAEAGKEAVRANGRRRPKCGP